MVFFALLLLNIQGFGVFGDNLTDVLNDTAQLLADELRDTIYAIGIKVHRQQDR